MKFAYKKELISILLLSVFVFLLLSFLSFNPKDSSWFYFASDNKIVTNWVGKIGATCAAFFFFYFGAAAYVVLLGFILLGIWLFLKKPFLFLLPQILSTLILLIVCPTFLRAFEFDLVGGMPGGWIGNYFYNLLVSVFARSGMLITLFALLLVSSVLMLRISFVTIFLHITNFSKKLFYYLFFYSWIGLKFVGIQFWQLAKKLFFKIFDFAKIKIKSRWKKEQGSIAIEQSAQEEQDDEFWKSLHDLAQDKQNTEGQSFSGAGRCEVEQRFENKKSFTTFRKVFLFGQRIKILPNSILKNNFLKIFYANPTTMSDFAKQNCIEGAGSNHLEDLVKFDLPDLQLFKTDDSTLINKEKVIQNAKLRGKKLEEKLERFGIKGKITAIRPGPTITLFEYKPEIDSKISKIISLEDDLAMALQAMSIRIIAPIPGRSVVGFEISNHTRQTVFLSDAILKNEYKEFKGGIPLLLGVNIVGDPVVQDLVQMPHVLVAGSTGSGKSVGLNAMLIGMLCKFKPNKLKVILIDPKRLEFAPYSDIPHLLFPIVTNPRQAAPVLKWLVQEMEDRYEKMADAGVRNILEYQKIFKSKNLENMPFIVLMIDELADLMMVAGKDVEMQIARIAQMARAAGIHMIVATQRPSVDVVTGLIKVNFPSRIAFRVSSKIDSRTIVDSSGAEKLLGCGDMLYMHSSSSDLQRVHGSFVSDKQVENLANYLRAQQKPQYLNLNEELKRVTALDENNFKDELYDEILEFIKTRDEVSISMIQRHYRIGFNRSARIIEKLELDGLVAPAQGSKARRVLR